MRASTSERVRTCVGNGSLSSSPVCVCVIPKVEDFPTRGELLSPSESDRSKSHRMHMCESGLKYKTGIKLLCYTTEETQTAAHMDGR